MLAGPTREPVTHFESALGGDLLGGAGEEGLGEGWELLGVLGGHGSGFWVGLNP
jgi:hypothetical protein